MSKYHLLVAGLTLAVSQASADILFSEYIEGSSNNKAIELLNTGSSAVDLSTITIELYSNGNLTVQNQQTLSGSLPAGEVYVIANSGAAGDILAVADITSSVTYFNGNDVLLLRQNGQVVDRLGELGNDEYWGGEVTLVRHDDIVSGDPAFDSPFDPSTEWTAYDRDTFTYLGNGDSDGGDDPTPPTDLTCLNPATLISSVQGSGSSSDMEGQAVIVEGIVVADLQDNSQMSGFFLQEEDSDADNNPMTSEGIFVYHTDDDVNVGDQVRLLGTVDEYYSLTQINQVQDLVICNQGVALPTAAPANLPLGEGESFEAVEGMHIHFADTLTVNEVYNLGRYGEFMVADGRRAIPTDVAAPGPEADAVRAANDRNVLIVEDGIRYQNPDPMPFPAPGLSADNTLRVGYELTGLTGVVNYAYGAYKLIPTVTPVFEPANPRTEAPEAVAESELRVASFNVLNFFNGDGQGGDFPTPRGANDVYELERQTAKLVSAITAINADVIGLMEIENDGFGELSAIAELTAAINAELPVEDAYQYVIPNVDLIGDDDIAVGMLYRPSVVSPVGQATILDSQSSPLDDQGEPLFIDDLNRPALAQSVQLTNSDTVMTVVVNHFKSKGNSNCDDYSDCDQGQGAYNVARTKAAQALAQWLASGPTGVETDHVMILGDLNAYSQEDPLTTLMENGYQRLQTEDGYTYVYSGETGTLDHALATGPLSSNVVGVQQWHINTDEPRVLDYNTEYKTESQILGFYAPDAYRSSDHDPVIVDFAFNQAPVARIGSFPLLFWYVFYSNSYDPDGYLTYQEWTVDDDRYVSPWLFIPRWEIRRGDISSITLTVEDDQGATDSTTQHFKRGRR
ncbi:ExeM/NucH family extracellular endonuclease [Reinekea blandensis]|uniref:Predicted extracellular nuclease n=1 Tax=Reinekea blandensis MED297 TaxID=314283 RepID=A4BH21_9GAMM|nr:ExeM/NucH family extracellular endonuclease [Reinekea blandensis]EAR08520.1 predicted extracellular nuclease [Reinekea sp. MED297] [Reinekea blandensis MED297]